MQVIKITGTHVGDLIKNPEKFGLTSDEIKDAYNRYDEPMGHEGRARDELLLKALEPVGSEFAIVGITGP